MTDTHWNLNASATGHRSYGVAIPSASERVMQDAQREHDRLIARLKAADQPEHGTHRDRPRRRQTTVSCYGCNDRQVNLPNTRCLDCR